jgi:hypothetical protein
MSEKECYEKARNNLIKKCKRIIALANLNAPEIIICNEIKGIHTMMPMFEKGYRYFLEREIEDKMKLEKNKLGLCIEINCKNEILKASKYDFGHIMCYMCQNKYDNSLETQINDEKNL